MTTLRTYTGWLNQAVAGVARRMGVTVAGSSKETRVIIRVTVGMIAAIVKLLVDKGVTTDAEFQSLMGAYGTDAYDPEPVAPDLPPTALPDDVTNPDGPVGP